MAEAQTVNGQARANRCLSLEACSTRSSQPHPTSGQVARKKQTNPPTRERSISEPHLQINIWQEVEDILELVDDLVVDGKFACCHSLQRCMLPWADQDLWASHR
ncbi:hypothetical protein INR49_021582 [Caranx melampygus]|nr:hypothetical protein INR49_021582 [Caranx melampygus]